MRYLIVGGITVPLLAGIDLAQSYDAEEVSSEDRMADNSLRKMTMGQPKLTSEVRARGIVPPALQTLDFSQPMTVSCVEPIAINSASPNIAVPTARRTDAGSLPIGRAFIGDRVQRTACAMVGDTAQLTTVNGAGPYQVLYFPEIVAFVRLGSVNHTRGGQFDWTLTVREA